MRCEGKQTFFISLVSPLFSVPFKIIGRCFEKVSQFEAIYRKTSSPFEYSSTILFQDVQVNLTVKGPNTVFARAFAGAIQRADKDLKTQTCRQYSDHFIYLTTALSVLLFSITERSVLMALDFYYKGLLEKVTMQRTKDF